MKSLVKFINEQLIKEYQDKGNTYLTMKEIIKHMLNNLSPWCELENIKNSKDLQREFTNNHKIIDSYGSKDNDSLIGIDLYDYMFELINSEIEFDYKEELNDNEDVFVMINGRDSNKKYIDISFTIDSRWNWYNK